MERWYYRDHAPEIVRRYGPWLARFECYLPVPAPGGRPSLRLLQLEDDRGLVARTARGGHRERHLLHAAQACGRGWPPAFVRPQPTEHFLACDFLPLEKVCIRWLMLLRYPDGVTSEEGEDWFLRVHAPEVAVAAGARRVS